MNELRQDALFKPASPTWLRESRSSRGTLGRAPRDGVSLTVIEGERAPRLNTEKTEPCSVLLSVCSEGVILKEAFGCSSQLTPVSLRSFCRGEGARAPGQFHVK